MASKDACHEASHACVFFPLFLFNRALVPLSVGCGGRLRLMSLFSPADICSSCRTSCSALGSASPPSRYLPVPPVLLRARFGGGRASRSPPDELLKIMNFLSSCVLETKGCCVQPLSLLCAGALQEEALPSLYSNQHLHICCWF